MKKFLFTLAALFMVGTVCAEEYWYADDFEVTQAQLGKTITVPVKAHFDYAVSAAQINFTIPEGITLTRITKGSDFTIQVHDEWGDLWDAEQTVFVGSTQYQNLGWAFADMDYYEVDGEWIEYGSYKFLPGEYENQFSLTLRIAADFAGGDLIIESMPSCTYDLRPDVEVCPEGQDHFKTCHITVEGATPTLLDLEGDIVFSEVNQENGAFTVTYNGPEEGVTVEVLSMTPKRGEYNLPDYGTYTVTAKATKDGYNDLEDSADLTWTKPVPPAQTDAPNVVVDETEDGYLVTVTGNGTLTLYVDDEEVTLDENNQYLIPYTNTPEGEEHVVVAYAQAENELLSDPKIVEVQDPGQTPKPVINVAENAELGGYVVTVTGYGDLTLYVDDEEVTLDENNQYVIPYTNTPEGDEHGVAAYAQEDDQRISEPATATVEDPGQTAKPTIVYDEATHTVTVTGYGDINVLIEGYGEGDVITLTGEDEVTYTFELLDDDYEVTVSATAQDDGQRVSEYAIKDFVVPAKPVTPPTPTVGAPTFTGYSIDGIYGYGVYIYPTTDNSQIKYRVYEWNPETEAYDILLVDWTNYTGAEGEIYYTNTGGKYRVEAYAYIGDAESNIVGYEFEVSEASGINEMNAGKTVAGVRYFNLAGQEMQEANGMTIVVTTYTDGTTSAVKVMK